MSKRRRKHHYPAKDEEPAWRWRRQIILEFVRLAVEIAWDILRQGRGIP